VWKVVVLLRKYRPELKLQAIKAAPTGLLLCSNLSPTATALSERCSKLIVLLVRIDLPLPGKSFEIGSSRNLTAVRTTNKSGAAMCGI
jgi:hypothetical protein